MLTFLLNKFTKVDMAFFGIVAGIVVVGVLIYFLMPLFNKEKYQVMRDNLFAREKALKGNLEQRNKANEKLENEDK